MTHHIQSYKDLPVYAYQFQTKFRNEIRAKSGIMRGREFIMKDLYSFDTTQEGLDAYYEKVAHAYEKIFARAGIGAYTYKTFASGGSFAKFSHEFQTVCDAGEDIIYIHKDKKMAINEEVFTDEVLAELGVSRDDFATAKSIEVGNIFKLGTKYSEPLGLSYVDEAGVSKPVVMGSYGIGPGRLMGTIVELLSDEKGLVWPEEIAPYRVHLMTLGEHPDVARVGDVLYDKLQTLGIETLYDDRVVRPGEKFADSDLFGIPYRVVISEKTLKEGKIEVKKRTEEKGELIDETDFLKSL
jgi:prolyl-tRNA synthetase